jgi:hypothetical protein
MVKRRIREMTPKRVRGLGQEEEGRVSRDVGTHFYFVYVALSGWWRHKNELKFSFQSCSISVPFRKELSGTRAVSKKGLLLGWLIPLF